MSQLVFYLLGLLLAMTMLQQDAEAGMLMGKGAGRGAPIHGRLRRPWYRSRRYHDLRRILDMQRNEEGNWGIPKYDYGRLGRPEPCVGVCFYQKQLAAAEAAKKQRRGPSRRKRIFL